MNSIPVSVIRDARVSNLYNFVLSNHPDAVCHEGQSLRLKANHSVSIREGYCGYTDFSTGETGNSIDFLVKYLGYSFTQAVSALTGTAPAIGSASTLNNGNNRDPPCSVISSSLTDLPVRDPCGNGKVIHYLQSRGIPSWLSQDLLEKGLLYMEAHTRNVVFLSRNKDFYEMRGTVSGSSFHRCKKAEANRCWAYRVGKRRPSQAIVCEGAIDAVSLYVLRLMGGTEDGVTMYCGIGGVYNQKAIDRIRQYMPVLLAVDNDAAGDACRKRNSQDKALIPQRKDWNEDLCSILAGPDVKHM